MVEATDSSSFRWKVNLLVAGQKFIFDIKQS